MTAPEFRRIDDFLYVGEHVQEVVVNSSGLYEFVIRGVGVLSTFVEMRPFHVDPFMVNVGGSIIHVEKLSFPSALCDDVVSHLYINDASGEIKKKADEVDALRMASPLDKWKLEIQNAVGARILFIAPRADIDRVFADLQRVLGEKMPVMKEGKEC